MTKVRYDTALYLDKLVRIDAEQPRRKGTCSRYSHPLMERMLKRKSFLTRFGNYLKFWDWKFKDTSYWKDGYVQVEFSNKSFFTFYTDSRKETSAIFLAVQDLKIEKGNRPTMIQEVFDKAKIYIKEGLDTSPSFVFLIEHS